MTDQNLTLIATAAQVLAAFASVVALGFVGLQIRSARTVADLTALLEFWRNVTEQEGKLFDPDAARKQMAFLELLNFLEVTAAAVNDKLFPKVSRRIVRDKLQTSIAVLQCAPDWHKTFLDAVATSTTFSELLKFMKRNRRQIEEMVAMMKGKIDQGISITGKE